VKPARATSVVLTAVVAGVVGWLVLRAWLDNGHEPLPLPWTAVAGTLGLVVAVIAAGLPVRRWQQGRRDRALDPLVAARTVVLAKAAAYGGAVLAGWYAAQALTILPDVVGARRTRLLLSSLAFLAACGLSVAGMVVQHWCRLPPTDEDQQGDRDDAA
jgi:Protein of unknown function (DUF3180)